MTKKRDKKHGSNAADDKKTDRCFMGVEEASRERQKKIDDEPYS